MQAIIIWSITALATVSVVSGVKVGIRRLSEINFMFGQIILMVALFQEDTWCAPLITVFTQLRRCIDTCLGVSGSVH